VYSLAWTNHGKCIDLTNGSLGAGTQLQTWDCSGPNANQRWDVGYMVNSRAYSSRLCCSLPASTPPRSLLFSDAST
jgi:hypothetical protein